MCDRSTTLQCAIGQFSPTCRDIDANLATMVAQTRKAAALGAKIVLFPEGCTVGFGSGTDMRSMAQDVSGPTSDSMREIALREQIAIGYAIKITLFPVHSCH